MPPVALFRHRRKDVTPNDWLRMWIRHLRRQDPTLSVRRLSRLVRIHRPDLSQWLSGQRDFGRLRLNRLRRFARARTPLN